MLDIKEIEHIVKSNEIKLQEQEKHLKELEAKIHQNVQEVQLLDEVNKFFSTVLDEKVNKLKTKIEKIINDGLAYIFDEDIQIKIVSSFKRNKTEFSIVIMKDGVEGIKETYGGGVIAIISFLFKVVITLISGKKRLMVFDESLTFVSVEYQQPVSEFIASLCNDLDFDILLVSHQPQLEYASNKVYRLEKLQDGRLQLNTIK